MVKRVLLGFAAMSLAGVFLLFDAAPAGAVMDQGNCTGSGTFEKGGFTVTQAEAGVIEVPEKDSVSWKGDLPSAPSAPEAYNGKIEVEMPAPFPALKIDDWSGTSDSQGNSGVKDYDIPGWVPKNVELSVVGEHVSTSTTCKGHVKIKIKGGSVGPVSLGSLALTAATGVGLVLAGRPKVGV
ncbi:MAG: hypothetical protein QOD92_3224 [Acidimicrobiaceae bacterium]|jgi:hypothetical protein